MKKILYARRGLRLLPVLALLALALAVPGAARAQDNAAATVNAVTGDVLLHQSGRSVPATLRSGDKLFAGDEVETPPGAHVVFNFADGSVVRLGPGGLLTLAEARFNGARLTHNRLVLRQAALEFAAPPRNMADTQIRTPYGTVTPRSAHLAVGERNNQSWIYLQRGTADVTRGNSRKALTPGQGVRIPESRPHDGPSAWAAADLEWLAAALPGHGITAPATVQDAAPATEDAAPVAATPDNTPETVEDISVPPLPVPDTDTDTGIHTDTDTHTDTNTDARNSFESLPPLPEEPVSAPPAYGGFEP